MQLHRNDLSPEAIKILENTPKVELERLLGVEQQNQVTANQRVSQWLKIATEIEALNISDDSGQHILNCIQEFREDKGV